MPFDYYDKKLGAKKLRRVYEIAPPRVKQYLEAEVRHVLSLVRPGGIVLELGCGYGRVLKQLALQAGELYGVDTSVASLVLARSVLSEYENVFLAQMNAAHLAFRDHCFDLVVCIQNGISAFHVDQRQLIQESMRVTKPGGLILFSSYSHKFWDHRLHWFELQVQHGLLGEIDYEKTGHGVMVCKDGFTATTVEEHRFMELCQDLSTQVNVVEVDDSSLFCEIRL
ncbi:MAG: class I SAM-dependent methyltransferase [candidate division Zixibacteria bacterium]|nr:class I SAM-dependent methyltransferase [candidate division Zixibacteria bacterium]